MKSNIAFPTITPGHEIFLDNEILYIRNTTKTFRLTGSSGGLIEQLLRAADGTMSISDLASSANCSTEAVEGVITRLQKLGIVTDASCLDVPDGIDFMVANTLQALIPTKRTDHLDYQAMLKKRVLTIGPDELTQEINKRLVQHGLNHLDSLNVEREGNDLEHYVLTTQPDLLIHTSRIEDYKMALECNRIALTHNTAWISTWTDGMIITLMPVMLPNQTACFECFLDRQRSHYDQQEADSAFEQYLINGRPDSLLKVRNQNLFIDQIQIDLLVVRSLRYLMGAKELGPVSKVIEFDLKQLALTHHPLLRMPNCPTCSPNQSQPPIRPFNDASYLAKIAVSEVN
jgi:bacteriocin biosynthesis cyclodehydratase domain-containing protein